MIDINRIRENPEAVKEALKKKLQATVDEDDENVYIP